MRLTVLEQILLTLAVLGGFSLVVNMRWISNHIHHTQHNVHYYDFIRQKVNNLTSSIEVCDKLASMYQYPWDPILRDLQHAEGFLWQQFFENRSKQTTLRKRDGLYQASDLVILIPTGHVTRSRAAAVKGMQLNWSIHETETWGKHVGELVFVSDLEDSYLPTSVVSNSSAEGSFALSKVVEGWKYLFNTFGEEYKWFGKMDDDTFLIVDNLLKQLDQYDHTEDHYFGMCNIQSENGPSDFRICSGGAGYIISQSALKKLHAALSSGKCLTKLKEEDVAIATCLYKVGVVAVTLPGFKSNSVISHLLVSRDIIEEPVTFHGVYPKMMLELDWILHYKEKH